MDKKAFERALRDHALETAMNRKALDRAASDQTDDELRAAMVDAEQRLAEAFEHLDNAPLISRSRDCALAELSSVSDEFQKLLKIVKARTPD